MLATNSALTLGMHHSFFCHGLRVFFETLSDSLMGHGGRQPQLDHLAGQETQGPVVMAFRRRTAGQRDQVGLAPVVQLPMPVGLAAVLQNLLQPFFGKALLDPVYCAPGHIQSFGHLRCGPTVAAL